MILRTILYSYFLPLKLTWIAVKPLVMFYARPAMAYFEKREEYRAYWYPVRRGVKYVRSKEHPHMFLNTCSGAFEVDIYELLEGHRRKVEAWELMSDE